MTQLTEKIREALLGNVGSIICGRIGVTDADIMVKAFSPTFTAEDLTKTPNYSAIAKVMMFDVPSAPFTMKLPPLMGEPSDKLMETLKAYSATKYGKTRAEVEKEIEERWSRAEREKSKIEEIASKAPSSRKDDFLPKNVENINSAPKTPANAQESPEEGFLDGWLNRQE